ncbi:MAG: pyridoxamine 5'-phosphate oxidase family protein [Phenylobacterium sp.]|uniref:pyridoxamine 5'-phosphate oxidase family protein n=1 Tax=Phenylobacterium sp. TaxID=1871053 RepID=UPI0027329DEF|nr:pyridoxamine 5'-phosphate oxidase family protein [Phenylobacterium sp.]MDP3175619.1 pyridoxamine 5'-phosphate oxidase family protein [Phenylobacterium sp.]
MTSESINRSEAEKRLWNEFGGHRTVMLGLDGGDAHFQPMTAFAEPDSGTIWFYARADGDLARHAGGGQAATMILQTKDLHACLDGQLSVQADRARIDKYWSPVVAAWYPEGKDDPNLTMLRLDAADAQLWITEAGPVKFMWEIVKANATKSTPDLGERTDISLH